MGYDEVVTAHGYTALSEPRVIKETYDFSIPRPMLDRRQPEVGTVRVDHKGTWLVVDSTRELNTVLREPLWEVHITVVLVAT